MRAFPSLGFPSNVLAYIRQHSERHTERDGVAERPGSFRSSHSQQSCQEQGPASGSDQRWYGNQQRCHGRPYSRVVHFRHFTGLSFDRSHGATRAPTPRPRSSCRSFARFFQQGLCHRVFFVEGRHRDGRARARLGFWLLDSSPSTVLTVH